MGMTRELGPGWAIVEAEALTELLPVIPAAAHLHDVTREEKEKREGKKKVVEEADHSPVFFWRKMVSVAP